MIRAAVRRDLSRIHAAALGEVEVRERQTECERSGHKCGDVRRKKSKASGKNKKIKKNSED